jgi:hypothetical protein
VVSWRIQGMHSLTAQERIVGKTAKHDHEPPPEQRTLTQKEKVAADFLTGRMMAAAGYQDADFSPASDEGD